MTPTALRRLATACVAGALLSTTALAQQPTIPAAALPQHRADALMDALDVGDFSLQQLELPADPTGHVFTPVQLGDTTYTVALVPHGMTAEGYRLTVDDGTSLRHVAPGAGIVWRGELLELPGSSVAGVLDDGQLDVTIRLGSGLGQWAVQPAADVLPGSPADEHVVFSLADSLDRGHTCGGAIGDVDARPEPSAPSFAGSADDVLCEIAIDADFPFYQSNGSSVANTEADILDIMNRVETIYMNEVNIQYLITEIIVRTNSNDPYTTSSPSGLLNQFAAEWNANHTNIQRDIAHLFTGTNLDGSVIGIASLNVICAPGYGLSQSKFSSNKTSRAGLTAHELGHNWASPHCDGSTGCAIMCSGLGGCTGNLQVFGPNATNTISNKATQLYNQGCLDDAVPPPAPQLLGLSLATAQALGGESMDVTLLQQASKVKTVEVAGVELPKGLGGWNVLNDQVIRLTVPTASQLGATDVQVSNLGGSSNVLTFDVVETSPPHYSADLVAFSASGDMSAHFTFATGVGDTVYWILAIDNTNLPYQGFPFLVNAFYINPFPVNAAGILELALPLTGIPVLTTFYTQAAFFDGGLETISPIASTLVL